MEKQHEEEGLDVSGEANKSELEGANKRRESGEDKLDGVKETHADTTLPDDDKIKHPRVKPRPHESDSENVDESSDDTDDESDSENSNEKEDSENADDDTDDDAMDDDDDWLDHSRLKERSEQPSPFAFPASLLSYVRENHNPPPTTDTVLVNILEDDEGLVRENMYPVWEMEMEMQKRKMKVERISLAYSNLMKLECCLAIIDHLKKKSL